MTAEKPLDTLPLLSWMADYLSRHGIESPRVNAEVLLAHLLQVDRTELIGGNMTLSPAQSRTLDGYLRRRIHREPLQYITGETWFMGLRFDVDRRVLIPRPETEVLVELVLKHARGLSREKIRVLDIGTGSGNIAVSLVHHNRNIYVDAVDISPDALTVASLNTQRHGLSDHINLIQADICSPALPVKNGTYDIVVANPPYISETALVNLEPEIRLFEPAVALTDHGDGLEFYRVLGARAMTMLREHGSIFVEIAFDQRQAVEQIFQERGFMVVESFSDLDGNSRVVRGRRG